MPTPKIQVFPDAAAIAQAAADHIVQAAQREIDAKGSFSLALSGGSTPKMLYTMLAEPPYVKWIEWDKVHLYFGDERGVPPEHKDSNFKMASETLLDVAPIPPANIHRMKGELPAEEAAKEYGLMLKQTFGDGGIDLVLLGMGDDGHTASIFPHTIAVKEKEHRVIGYFAENSSTGKSWRITMTAPFLNRSKEVLILLAGKNKAERLKEVLEGEREPERLPIQLIDPPEGQVIWMLDVGAAGME